MNATKPCKIETIDRFLDDALSADDLLAFEDHLGQCARCESELERRTTDARFRTDTRRFLSDTSAPPDSDLGGSRPGTVSEPEAALMPGLANTNGAGNTSVGPHAAILALLDPTDHPDSLGRLAGYEVTGVIGWGGMGIVFKARDVSLDRFVAIKLLHPSYGGQSAARQRFAREAQAAAAVVHDHVIAIHGVDQWKDLPFLVMPYVKGESLQQRIDRNAPLGIDDLLRVGIQIARGLAAAHDQGLIHRDVKPANVLMPAGVSRVILTDFGLARAADDASLTRSGVLAGTPQYMSPEQARGETLDGRSDLFSLGSVLYSMACGRPPFRGESSYGVLRTITDRPHRPVIELRNDCPPWLSQVIDRCLAKDPRDRFDSAHQLADHLEEWLAHRQQPTTTQLPARAPSPSARRTRRWILAVGGGIVLVLGAWGWSVAWNGGGSDSPSSDGVATDNPADGAEHFPAGTVGPWRYDDSVLTETENALNELMNDLAAP